MEADESQRSPFVINLDEFNTEAFIDEVKQYPSIWNYKCDAYNNKLERLSYWALIGEKLFDDYAEKTAAEKCEITFILQKKWKCLRDSFTRYLIKAKKCQEAGVKKPRAYTYFQKLSFLLTLTDTKIDIATTVPVTFTPVTEPKFELVSLSEANSAKSESNSTIESTSESEMHKTNRKRKQNGDGFLVKKINKRVNDLNECTKNIDQDEDMMFLLSLNSEFKKISDEYKFDAKFEIMDVIRKYKNLSEQTQHDVFYKMEHT